MPNLPIARTPWRSFGFFPIAGKETRPAGRNPRKKRKKDSSPLRSSGTPFPPPLACGFPTDRGHWTRQGEAGDRQAHIVLPYRDGKKKKGRQRAPAQRRGPLPVCVVVKEREKWEICMITGYNDILTDNCGEIVKAL